jgi:hypothetical protein
LARSLPSPFLYRRISRVRFQEAGNTPCLGSFGCAHRRELCLPRRETLIILSVMSFV